ncbi:hypothetical protein KEF29_19410 [Streptomyces tuirus]|uniref:Uncharacterized protein n=1 Tax=Streptomyces tuirus TaxID=68278 RepID=A0A941FIJ7_9ACTN|nr:hypothetical protein [Streptomyces tuirus]
MPLRKRNVSWQKPERTTHGHLVRESVRVAELTTAFDEYTHRMCAALEGTCAL